jgi:hypothetical protein
VDIEVMPSVAEGYTAGEVEYKVYTGISGVTVASLTGAPSYPNSPASTSILPSLGGTYSGSNYGATLTTTIVAPETGPYRFYIASDDESSLRFNPNGPSPDGATQIASVTGWTDVYQWNKYSSQQSAIVNLTAGQQYALQALHKESSGGDHFAIGWTTPSTPTIAVITAPYLARAVATSTPEILTHPQPVTANLGDNVALSFTSTGSDLSLYQWRLNGTNFGAPQTTPTLTLNNIGARLAGSWDCVFTDGSTVLTTNAVTVTIQGVGTVTNGSLWQEVFTGVSGGTVEDLLSHPSYPLLSTSSGVLTEPRTGSFGDDYGQRWSGWLIPSTTGRYRFYAAADDQTRLYLSPTEYESHKQLIHSITSYTGEMSWSSRAPSAWFSLEAGQRYYVEFLHAEGGGGDHAAFTWQREGDPTPTNGASLIPAGNLQSLTGGNAPDGNIAPPFAVADRLIAESAVAATLDPLSNDLDASHGTLAITAVTQPSHGHAGFQGRQVTYTSDPGFSGSDAFSYTVTNSLGLTATAVVSVAVGRPWDGLVAWWRFDEGSGTTAADRTGNGHTATLTSGTTWTAGQSGNAVYIASSTQMAATPAGKPIPGALTISAWMKPTNTSGVDTIFSFGNTAAFRINGSRLRFTTFGVLDHDTNTGMFSSGVWTHVAVTFTPGVSNGAKFYVNGVLAQSLTSSALNTPSGVWRIGASHISGEWFGGALDDVRLYDRVLTEADIALIVSAPTPWQQWRMDQFTSNDLANLTRGGATADPDQDGIENLLEYALGLNPFSPEPLSSRVTNDLDSDGRPRLTVTKDPQATDVRYAVETSPDLATWSLGDVVILQDTPTIFQVRDLLPLGGAERRFLRLRVTQP